ncbi:uncharacterized protein LOC121267165 [Juglans microcarpa x Juglans regia]|uniref:uncharacterized protein LOC121267165 n=1 Tax=Juglans microcarpa x Juglans regia TaxID=2249226 RepID=UPI001B7E11F4|nr:uncharacterized protein LOC121267165 [Juglans microcarpa x Juglans regia]
MEIKPIFRAKRIIHRKKQFDENVNEETTQSTEESFRINYFLFVVDQAISSIQIRFEQFEIYGCFCRKKFFKIKIDKILSKINNVA